MDEKVKGIVVSSKDYKDNDKLLTLFTLEKGIVFAKIVGVKKPNAKLKAVKELFCFAEFDLARKGDFLTITSANIIESFHNLTSDIEKFYAGCLILEVIKTVVKENQSNELLFLETLKSLQAIAFDNISPNLVKARFLIKIFEAMGYRLSLTKCATCGENFVNKRYFSPSEGSINCPFCKTKDAIEISNLTHSTMRLASETPFEKLKSLKLSPDALETTLNLLVKNFEIRFDKKLITI